MIPEMVILAMIAAFLGLRLYSVLGERAEEEESVPRRFETDKREIADSDEQRQSVSDQSAEPVRLEGVMPAVERGVREIASVDRSFDIISFLEGAKGAYGMILEAYWSGDKDTLRELCDEDVYAGFAAAIDAREAAGQTLQNKLIRIEDTKIHAALLDGNVARVSVLFVADIATVTRDSDDNVIAGSLDDAVESRDIWTFSRDMNAASPDWVLDETDEG